MKTLIVCASVSHGNTAQVASVLGQVLDAPVVEPERVDPAELAACDVLGLGSGIFNMSFHPRLRDFAGSLPGGAGRRAFVFATSGLPEPPFRPYLRSLAAQLEQKGYRMVGTFSCRAYDTYWPFRIVGGINKRRPNSADLASARTFAHGLRAELAAST